MVLPQPLSTGERLKICAFDEEVVIEGCGQLHELKRGESAAYIAVMTEDDQARRWERVQAIPS